MTPSPLEGQCKPPTKRKDETPEEFDERMRTWEKEILCHAFKVLKRGDISLDKDSEDVILLLAFRIMKKRGISLDRGPVLVLLGQLLTTQAINEVVAGTAN